MGRRLGVVVMAVGCLASGSTEAAFPGQNGRIAFYRNGDVWSVAADGSDEMNLTQHEGIDSDQRWSPDGTRIVFASDRTGNRDVWVMDADGGNQIRLTTDPANDLQPAWSPDGTKILFMTERDGNREIYVMNADGSNQVNLTNSPAFDDDDEAQWSPDGSTISFYRDGDVWLMDADGGNQRNATNAAGSDDFDQNWSPDGTQMVFDSNRDGDREIFLMDADGGNQVQLTRNDVRDRQPVFSPDGTKILFESDRDGPDQLYVMDADGQNQQRLVTSGTDDQEPDWQPVVPPTTTTTTLPGNGTPLEGKKLLLKDKAGNPQKRALKLVAKDPDVGTGAENRGPGDPTVHGGSLTVFSASGGFDKTYDLPALNWHLKGKPGKNKGYKLKSADPIKTVLVKLGKSLKVVAKGEALAHTLDADPNPVHVELRLGAQVYCLTFGGQTKFKAGKMYMAKKAKAPDACPTGATSTTSTTVPTPSSSAKFPRRPG